MTSTLRKPAQVTPAKLLLIAVLTMVLIGVLISQFTGKKSSRSPVIQKRRTQGNKTDVVDSDTAPVVQRRWPEVSLSKALQHDPFSLPLALRPRVEEPADAALEVPPAHREELRRRKQLDLINKLRRDGVDMVVMTEHGRVARIGNLHLREGDVVEGMRVKEIHEKGVVLVPAE